MSEEQNYYPDPHEKETDYGDNHAWDHDGHCAGPEFPTGPLVRIDASEAGELGMEFFEFHVASDALIVIFEDGEAEDCIEDYDDCGP